MFLPNTNRLIVVECCTKGILRAQNHLLFVDAIQMFQLQLLRQVCENGVSAESRSGRQPPVAEAPSGWRWKAVPATDAHAEQADERLRAGRSKGARDRAAQRPTHKQGGQAIISVASLLCSVGRFSRFSTCACLWFIVSNMGVFRGVLFRGVLFREVLFRGVFGFDSPNESVLVIKP